MYNGKIASLATGRRFARCSHVVWFAIACESLAALDTFHI